MAGITRREREDKARIADIKLKLADPSLPLYLFAKLQGTLSGLQDKQDRRVEARRAAAKAAEPVVYPNVLPDNFRLRTDRPEPVPAFDLQAYLDAKAINRD